MNASWDPPASPFFKALGGQVRTTGIGLAAMLLAPCALANGRFPQASLLVFQPGKPEHMLVRSTFGLLESREGGANFEWTCEAALGLQGQEDPMIALTRAGTRVAATRGGFVASSDGCNWVPNPDLKGAEISDLTLAASTPGRILALQVRPLPGDGYTSQLLVSDDDGVSFAARGEPLPQGMLALTVDVAPSDSRRVYVTARLGLSEGYASVLLRSKDAGVSFEQLPLPDTANQKLAYIAAVHPQDPDRLYLRINGISGTVLRMSADGGDTFDELLKGKNRLLGFAVSPDGSRIAVGGPADGVWAGNADGSKLEQRSLVAPSCLSWSESGLYACGSAATDFAIGRSLDEGATFESIMRIDQICKMADCGAETQVGSLCPGYISSLSALVGASCNAMNMGGASGGSQAGGSNPGGRDGADSPGASGGSFSTGGTFGGSRAGSPDENAGSGADSPGASGGSLNARGGSGSVRGGGPQGGAGAVPASVRPAGGCSLPTPRAPWSQGLALLTLCSIAVGVVRRR